MTHSESTLPKWARDRLSILRLEISRLKSLETAAEILMRREWFVIQGQQAGEPYPRKLWWLNHDEPFPCCSLGNGDVLLVGRARFGSDHE